MNALLEALPVQDRIDLIIEPNTLRRLGLTLAACLRHPAALVSDVAAEAADFSHFCHVYLRAGARRLSRLLRATLSGAA